jgi:hypothetical protein
MDESYTTPVTLISVFAHYPIEILGAFLMVYFVFTNRIWAMFYVQILVIGISYALEELGSGQLIAGIFIGVASNELFRFIRRGLDKENRNNHTENKH